MEPIPISEQVWPEGILPLVSICSITYNHEPFIRECIEGFLMQKTTFPVEILLHDDASTDNTANIIREYEAKYPNIIKPIYQSENQYSQGIGISMTYQFPRAKGKYIALCEGDDYWTDPLKLQKQVDFLEANPEYSLCVGGFESINVYTNEKKRVVITSKKINLNNSSNGYTLCPDNAKFKWLTKTLTAVFVNNREVLVKNLSKYKYRRDTHLFYHLLKTGKGFYFTEVLGVYRIHQGGVNSMKHEEVKMNIAYNIYSELYDANKDEFTRYKKFHVACNLFHYYLFNRPENISLKKTFSYLKEAIKVMKIFKETHYIFYTFIPPKLKKLLKSLKHLQVKITP